MEDEQILDHLDDLSIAARSMEQLGLVIVCSAKHKIQWVFMLKWKVYWTMALKVFSISKKTQRILLLIHHHLS